MWTSILNTCRDGRAPARGGFTLLETIVALTLVVAASAGPLALAAGGILNSNFSRNKLVALNLAQEGIEIIRSYRENNILAGAAWDAGILMMNRETRVDVICSSSPCTPARATNYNYCSGSYCTLLFDAASGLYSYSGGTASLFSRIVKVERLTTDQMRVTSTVQWSEHGIGRRAELQEVLYNWR